jgi:hypothetical protein
MRPGINLYSIIIGTFRAQYACTVIDTSYEHLIRTSISLPSDGMHKRIDTRSAIRPITYHMHACIGWPRLNGL